MIFKK